MRTTEREIAIAVTAVGTEPQKACRQTGGNCKAMAPIACKISRRDRQAWGDMECGRSTGGPHDEQRLWLLRLFLLAGGGS